MPEQTQSERLHDLLEKKFGHDWRYILDVSIRLDTFSWFVHLAEYGIKYKEEEFTRAVKEGRMRKSEAIASLAHWKLDLEQLVSTVEQKLRDVEVPQKT